jgi:glycine/D-amino acid oxidase-like deaminating enzyme
MSDVAVLGGGVIGLACAAAISNRGADVTLLEATTALGQASSARANGGFRAQFTTAPNIAFSRFSIGAFEAMPAERIGLHQTGYLLLTGSSRGADGLRVAAALQRSLGVETEWLEPEEIMSRVPFVRSDGLIGGTFHARDGFLDPAGVCGELADRAAADGATILTDARVRAASHASGGFLLLHARGELRADVVVNAVGADARSVARLLGADVPVDPVRRNLAHIQDAPGELTPMVVDIDTGVLVRREPTGGWIVSYANPRDPPGRETTVDPTFADALAERLPHRFPFLLDLPLDPRRWWAGLYPETPDHHAIVGFDSAVPRLVHCVGFGGHGVMHAPAAGRAVAELIADGACTTFDLDPLRPSRFAEGDLVVETAVF